MSFHNGILANLIVRFQIARKNYFCLRHRFLRKYVNWYEMPIYGTLAVFTWSFRLVMYRLILSLLLSASLFSVVSREKAEKFESLATNQLGVLPQLSGDLRSRRVGPVCQCVSISPEGIMTITQKFYCKALGDEQKVRGTCEKRFYLRDFVSEASQRRYECNPHMNTIMFTDHQGQWSIGFRSTEEMNTAAALLDHLVSKAPEKPASNHAPSSFAASAGFRYLVVAPRAESLPLSIRLLTCKQHSRCVDVWLTKHTPEQIIPLLHEARNALPLLFYDLQLIDTVPFFTVSTPGAAAFQPCGFGKTIEQSVVSDDAIGLAKAFSQPFVGLRFDSMPDFSSPVAVICRLEDKHRIYRCAKSEGITTHDASWYTRKPLLYRGYIPEGSVYSWFLGLNENSFDVLRYCLLDEPMTMELFSGTLYREFPQLEGLLASKSRYVPELSLAESICVTSKALSDDGKELSALFRSTLKVALFTHELGIPFGPPQEAPYNTWPLALLVAEKAGFREYQKRALCALINSPLQEEKACPPCEAFFKEALVAAKIGMPVGEWLRLKWWYWKMIQSLFKDTPRYAKEALQRLQSLQSQFQVYGSFGIPCGAYVCHGPLPVRSLYSSYLWEVRDPQHRDGLSLKRRRDRFESMLLENPRSSWKGRFWDWLQKEAHDCYPNRYLTDRERLEFKALFQEGRLVKPVLPKSDEEIELMFVIGEDGQAYVGYKKEAESSDLPGFNHASFFAGGPVASAGKIRFLQGVPVAITNKSGHYRSTTGEMVIAIQSFQKLGVNIDALWVYLDHGGEKREFPSGIAFLDSYQQ